MFTPLQSDVDSLFRAMDANNDGAVHLGEWLDHLPRGTRVRIIQKSQDEPTFYSRIEARIDRSE